MTAQRGHDRYLVVDASVSLKWALDDEEAVPQAVALRDAAVERRHELVAPSLWLYELTNGLVVAVRRGRLTSELAAQVHGHLMAIGVLLADPEPRDVYEEALGYGLTAYDAAYIALARALSTALWTGDRRLQEKVRDSALVRWIGDYH